MRTTTIHSFNVLLDEIFNTTMRVARNTMGAIRAMSWQRLVVTCIALAFLLAAFPFVATLIVTFAIVKLVVGSLANTSRRETEQETPGNSGSN